MLLINILKESTSILLFIFSQIIIISAFAIIYWVMTHRSAQVKHFKGLDDKSSLLSYFYYSLAMQTTIGGGDITPITKSARILAIIQMLTIYLGIGISERHIMKYMTSKQYWGPILIISGLIIAAFAPPLSNVIVRVLMGKKKQEVQLLKKKTIKILH